MIFPFSLAGLLLLGLQAGDLPAEVESFLASAEVNPGGKPVFGSFAGEKHQTRWYVAIQSLRSDQNDSRRLAHSKRALRARLQGEAVKWGILYPVAGEDWEILARELASEYGGWRYSGKLPPTLFSRTWVQGEDPIRLVSVLQTQKPTPAELTKDQENQLRCAWGLAALKSEKATVEDAYSILTQDGSWADFPLTMYLCQRLVQDGREEEALEIYDLGMSCVFQARQKDFQTLWATVAALGQQELANSLSNLIAQQFPDESGEARLAWMLANAAIQVPPGHSWVAVGEHQWALSKPMNWSLKDQQDGGDESSAQNVPAWWAGSLELRALQQANDWEATSAKPWSPWSPSTATWVQQVQPTGAWRPVVGGPQGLLACKLGVESRDRVAVDSAVEDLEWFTVKSPPGDLNWEEAVRFLQREAARDAMASLGWTGSVIDEGIASVENWSEAIPELTWGPDSAGKVWNLGVVEPKLTQVISSEIPWSVDKVFFKANGFTDVGLNSEQLRASLATFAPKAQWEYIEEGEGDQGAPTLEISFTEIVREKGEEPSELSLGRAKPWGQISAKVVFTLQAEYDFKFMLQGRKTYGSTLPTINLKLIIAQAPPELRNWLTLSLNANQQ